MNTAFTPDGVQVEVLEDGRALVDWLVAAELLERSAANSLAQRLGTKALNSAASGARELRERTRTWLEGARGKTPRRNLRAELGWLNELLRRGVWRRQVVAGESGPSVAEALDVDTADALLALLAWQIALLLTQEDLSLIKQCAGPGCTIWFLDRTKAHHRRFCSAAACGNRAKVAAFRDRRRQE